MKGRVVGKTDWVMAFGLYFVDCTVVLPSISHRKLLRSAMMFR